MKRTLLLVGSIMLIGVLLLVRLVTKESNRLADERKWFVNALRYEFSAHVDSVRMFNAHTGRLWCRLTDGNPQVHREDSLKRLFRQHDMLYLIFHRSSDSIIFIVPNGDRVAKGDSVRISSHQNTIQFFRSGKQVTSDSLSTALIGYTRPFFLKRK